MSGCRRRYRGSWLLVVLLIVLGPTGVLAATDDWDENADILSDQVLSEPLEFPSWFKLSFLDLREDLADLRQDGKAALILYFGQKYCAYCKALLEKDFGLPDIRRYTQVHFDVIGLDIHGSRMVTDLSGKEMTEKMFALDRHVNFTPTLVFIDPRGRVALRLNGYYPPYKFRAALEYVADGYYRSERLRDYLARADVPLNFGDGSLSIEDFFQPPPYNLDRSHWPAQRPLVVFFERPDCHACDVLHTGPLQEPEIHDRLRDFDAVQLNLVRDTPVVTPAGKRLTARQWAAALNIFYTPTLVFFDRHGHEILRVDSVVQFYRLRNVLDYIRSGDWRRYPNFQQWRERHTAPRPPAGRQ